MKALFERSAAHSWNATVATMPSPMSRSQLGGLSDAGSPSAAVRVIQSASQSIWARP